jgi:hypothetical protein
LNTLFQAENLSPLLVEGDSSCLFHATNAAHQVINDNIDILPSPDLRLAACTLTRDFLLSNNDLCTDEILLEIEESLSESHDIFNEYIFQSLATIRNGTIIILSEDGDIKHYARNPDMQLILLKGREHPITPQNPIILLHRSSTQPLHFDATQPTFIVPSRHKPNSTNTEPQMTSKVCRKTMK